MGSKMSGGWRSRVRESYGDPNPPSYPGIVQTPWSAYGTPAYLMQGQVVTDDDHMRKEMPITLMSQAHTEELVTFWNYGMSPRAHAEFVLQAVNTYAKREEQLRRGLEAIRLTVEYVGEEMLPSIDGWSHHDWVKETESLLKEEFHFPEEEE